MPFTFATNQTVQEQLCGTPNIWKYFAPLMQCGFSGCRLQFLSPVMLYVVSMVCFNHISHADSSRILLLLLHQFFYIFGICVCV